MTRYRIPSDTRQYIIETLRFAPATQRELQRHMHRRADFEQTMQRLVSEGLVTVTGTGKKGSPRWYRLAIPSPNI